MSDLQVRAAQQAAWAQINGVQKGAVAHRQCIQLNAKQGWHGFSFSAARAYSSCGGPGEEDWGLAPACWSSHLVVTYASCGAKREREKGIDGPMFVPLCGVQCDHCVWSRAAPVGGSVLVRKEPLLKFLQNVKLIYFQ